MEINNRIHLWKWFCHIQHNNANIGISKHSPFLKSLFEITLYSENCFDEGTPPCCISISNCTLWFYKKFIIIFFSALGTGNDNFVKCPAKALDWRTRRFRMLEEIVRHNADVICLQEVDHFRFFRKSLNALGYSGHFTPKPDSPCLYLPENAGPDGCAIFYKRDKFDFIQQNNRILEVWKVQSNQVC